MKEEAKSLVLCLVAFVLGCLCVFAISGCSVSSQAKIKPTLITTTLEVECCPDCGFAPWTDSWCEEHFGT